MLTVLTVPERCEPRWLCSCALALPSRRPCLLTSQELVAPSKSRASTTANARPGATSACTLCRRCTLYGPFLQGRASLIGRAGATAFTTVRERRRRRVAWIHTAATSTTASASTPPTQAAVPCTPNGWCCLLWPALVIRWLTRCWEHPCGVCGGPPIPIEDYARGKAQYLMIGDSVKPHDSHTRCHVDASVLSFVLHGLMVLGSRAVAGPSGCVSPKGLACLFRAGQRLAE